MKNVWRAMIEVGFIIFLFYSNLLMGEFEIGIAVSITSGWPVTHALKSSEMNASESAFAGDRHGLARPYFDMCVNSWNGECASVKKRVASMTHANQSPNRR